MMRIASGPTSNVLRWYLGILGAMLLSQGAVSLGIRVSQVALPPLVQAFVNADPVHAVVHIAWGLAMLLAVAVVRRSSSLASLALIFGVFYTGLALLGTAVYHPFGLQLGIGENVFHFVVGPTTLVLGVLALDTGQRREIAAAFPGDATSAEHLTEAAGGEQQKG